MTISETMRADASLDAELILAFVDHLRSVEELYIGPREEAAIVQLLMERFAEGQADPRMVHDMLAVLVVRGDAERSRFDRAFAAHFGALGPQPLSPSAQRRPRRRTLIALGIAACIAAALLSALGYFFFKPQQQMTPTRPASEEMAVLGVGEAGEPPSRNSEGASAPIFYGGQNTDAANYVSRVALAALSFDGAPRLEELAERLAPLMSSGVSATALRVALEESVNAPSGVALPVLDDARLLARLAYGIAYVDQPRAQLPPGDFLNHARLVIAQRPQRLNAFFEGAQLWPGGSARVRLADASAAELWLQQNLSANFVFEDEDQKRRFIELWALAHGRPAPMAAPPSHLTDYMVATLLGAGAIVAGFVIWLLAGGPRRRAFLKRMERSAGRLLHQVVAPFGHLIVDALRIGRSGARALREPDRRLHSEIDGQATLEHELRTGQFRPVYAKRQSTPHYLVLIEAEGASDIAAGAHHSLVEALRREGVAADIFYVQGDVAWCYPEGSPGAAPFAEAPIPVQELANRFAASRLLILGEGGGLLRHDRAELRSSALVLEAWPHRFLLTPKPVQAWSEGEWALARCLNMPVGRATREGLIATLALASGDAEDNRATLSPVGDLRVRALSAPLQRLAQACLYDAPPTAFDWAEARAALIAHLGHAGYVWLCASAAYPILRWSLVGFLGVMMKDGEGAPLFDERTLAAMAVLPFLRQGKLQDWVRRRLLEDLGARREETRALLAKLLEAESADSVSAMDVRLALNAPGSSGASGPASDAVFADFMARRDAGDVDLELPDAVARRLSPKTGPLQWWKSVAKPLTLAVLYAFAFLVCAMLAGAHVFGALPRGLPAGALAGAVVLFVGALWTFAGDALANAWRQCNFAHAAASVLIGSGGLLAWGAGASGLGASPPWWSVLFVAAAPIFAWTARIGARRVLAYPRAVGWARHGALVFQTFATWFAAAFAFEVLSRDSSGSDFALWGCALGATLAGGLLLIAAHILRRRDVRPFAVRLTLAGQCAAALIGLFLVVSGVLSNVEAASPRSAFVAYGASSDGALFAAGDASGEVRVYRRADGRLQRRFQLIPGTYAASIAFVGNDALVLSSSDARVIMFAFDDEGGRQIASYPATGLLPPLVSGGAGPAWLMAWVDDEGAAWSRVVQGALIDAAPPVQSEARLTALAQAGAGCWIAADSRGEILALRGDAAPHTLVLDDQWRGPVRRLASRPDGRAVRVINTEGAIQDFPVANCLIGVPQQAFPVQPALALSADAERRTFTIVIDAGHGGRDPGAISATGVREKDVVLDLALKLRDQLEAMGFRVMMTRDADRFVEHSDRVRFARDNRADLLISIHADSAPNPAAGGASVYINSERGLVRARSMAASQNWRLDDVSDQSDPLFELRQRETLASATHFAQVVSDRLSPVTPMLRNSIRSAGFFILLPPDLPSIHIEAGMLSNADDARNLADPAHRAMIARAIADAVSIYSEEANTRASWQTPTSTSTSALASSNQAPLRGLTGRLGLRSARMVRAFGEGRPAAQGVVLRTSGGVRILAPLGGQVTYSGAFRGYGNVVIINAENGASVVLAGFDALSVRTGQSVRVGDILGRAPNGQSADLYLELRRDGSPRDPTLFTPPASDPG